MRYLLVLTLVAGFLSLGCEKKKPEPGPTPPITAGPSDVMTGIPAATMPAIGPAPTPTPMPTPRPMPTPVGGKTYTVKAGDTLFGIARTQLGDGKRWVEIEKLNPDVKSGVIKAGQVLKLPEK